ncbi:MAG: hypothetical protein HZB21_07575 [Deltaproteobacteria bacterium]|nr:hypothetical protein [Deltaproteobacteria bacterium]
MDLSKSFDLNEKSEAFLFPAGKSYFKAFELPSSPRPFYLLIRSYMLGDQLTTAYILFPHILTLDEKFRIVRSTTPEGLRLKKGGVFEIWKETMGGLKQNMNLIWKIEGHLSFTEEYGNEKYLVLTTTESLLEEKLSIPYRILLPTRLFGIVTAIPTPFTNVAMVPASPAGHLNISIFPGVLQNIVVINHNEKAYAVFTMLADDDSQEFKGKENVVVASMDDVKKNPGKYISSYIEKNEYEGFNIDEGVIKLLMKFPAFPIGVTWNGGIAFTYNDYEYAKTTYQQYKADSEKYERLRGKTSGTDPLDPAGHLVPLLGR